MKALTTYSQKTAPLKTRERAFLLLFVVGPLPIVPFAAWLAASGYISWWYIWLMIVMYLFCAHGITVGYHRYVTHHSFVATTILKLWLLMWGDMGLEGGPIDWASKHIKHHRNSDGEGDPHSPISIRKMLNDRTTKAGRLFGRMQTVLQRWAPKEGQEQYTRLEVFIHHLIIDPEDDDSLSGLLFGLYHAHMGWYYNDKRPEPEVYAPELLEDKWMVFFNNTFFFWGGLSFLLPTLIGGYIGTQVGDGLLLGAGYGLLFGGIIRMVLVHHFTWAVNSVCHVWGEHPFFSGPTDHSGNVSWLGLFIIGSLGESYHGNHHAFPRSAIHARYEEQWWKNFRDISYVIIKFFELCRLASDVKVPRKEEYEARMSRQLKLVEERQQST